MDDTIYFIEEGEVISFFSHAYCLLNRNQKVSKIKKGKVCLRACCAQLENLKAANVSVS